jgi:NAD-dependent deacetylase
MADLSLRRDDAIVILTGAGISQESGLHTFRDVGGVWSQVKLEDVATPQGYARDPQQVQDFYNARRAQLADPAIKPNAAHLALGALEAEWAGPVFIVTQNVDDLHERAGSRAVLHMHGELRRGRCTACGDNREIDGSITLADACPNCGSIGTQRPDVVWFGEMPYGMDRIYAALAECALFVSVGTSGTVYPAAGFVAEARSHGAFCLELNLEPSQGATLFHKALNGPATALVPDLVAKLLGRG